MPKVPGSISFLAIGYQGLDYLYLETNVKRIGEPGWAAKYFTQSETKERLKKHAAPSFEPNPPSVSRLLVRDAGLPAHESPPDRRAPSCAIPQTHSCPEVHIAIPWVFLESSCQLGGRAR